MVEDNSMEYEGTVQKMILDLAEGFSKNDFESAKVEQIQKMISEIQRNIARKPAPI